jgi:hypothetical protein
VLERAKTVRALDRSATAIGSVSFVELFIDEISLCITRYLARIFSSFVVRKGGCCKNDTGSFEI